MSGLFDYNAPQYFDFEKNDGGPSPNDDFFFDIIQGPSQELMKQQDKAPEPMVNNTSLQSYVDDESEDDSDSVFFSPEPSGVVSTVRNKMRRSLSLGQVPVYLVDQETNQLLEQVGNLQINHPNKPSGKPGTTAFANKIALKEHVNKLAQPKYRSQDDLRRNERVTLAEGVQQFANRFRVWSLGKKNGLQEMKNTVARSPNLISKQRVRRINAISHAQQEMLEMEEAKKLQVHAHPLNKRILKGPIKPIPLEKKPPTVIEPFHLTEIKKKESAQEEQPAHVFHAQPVPKSIHHATKMPKVVVRHTVPKTPSFLKRFAKPSAKDVNQANDKKSTSAKPTVSTRTQPNPFSFDKRQQSLLKKKEEMIKKVFEEEKKAREFHANPPPKYVLRAQNSNVKIAHVNDGASTSSAPDESDSCYIFKAKPAVVLTKEPFVPIIDRSKHLIKVEEFQLGSKQRAEERRKYEQKLKEKQEIQEMLRKREEETMLKMEEAERAKLRKQTVHKAHSIRKYKTVEIEHEKKVTMPVSPKLSYKKKINKENLV